MGSVRSRRTPSRRPYGIALAAAVAIAPGVAASQDSPVVAVAPTRDVDLTMLGSAWWDVGYIATGAVTLSLGALVLTPPTVNVAPLDGLGHRGVSDAAATTSDLVLIVGMAGSAGLAALLEAYGAHTTGIGILRAPLILAESALMATGLVNLVKNIVGECRPRAWDDATATCVGTLPGMAVREDRVAFPSGHTAPLAAMAGASLGLVLLPSRPRTEFIPLLVLTATLAATNLVLREVAGAHTWVDTSVGYVLGFGVGLGTVLLHTRTTLPVRVGLSAGGAPGLQVSGAF